MHTKDSSKNFPEYYFRHYLSHLLAIVEIYPYSTAHLTSVNFAIVSSVLIRHRNLKLSDIESFCETNKLYGC